MQNNGKLLLVVNDVVKVELPGAWWAEEDDDDDDDVNDDDVCEADDFDAVADTEEDVDEEDFIDDVNSLPLVEVVILFWLNFKFILFLLESLQDFFSFLSAAKAL